MLGKYFQGTLPQLIERARLLKGKIPRTLPRDYGALIRTCETELDNIIGRLRGLQKVPAAGGTALHHTRLRQFKRAIADLDHIETTAIAVLNRAHIDDHHANRLLYRICQEIGYPLVTPTVTTLSTSYFYIDTKLNLMFIPPAEGSFLLHLPDLYHELGHPLLTHQDHPVLDRLRVQYLECMAHIHDHFAAQRAKEEQRRGPRGFKDQIDLWELLWSKYWLTEFFCDLYATLTLGPAFAWSHLHLYLKMGGHAFALSEGFGAWRVVAAYREDDGAMIGYARAVSDGETQAYLADVFVVEEARGLGVGKALVHAMIEEGPGPYFRWMLHTLDAHELYRAFGFAEPNSTYMERKGTNAQVFGERGELGGP